MPYDFLNRSHSGSGLVAIILDAKGDKIIGRGNAMDYNEPYDILPVDEYGKNGIDEIVPARMGLGTGTIGTMFIAGVNDNMPQRNTFISLGPYTVQVLVAPGFPNENTILDQLENVYFSGKAKNFNATGLAAIRVTFVFTNSISGANVQGATYPET